MCDLNDKQLKLLNNLAVKNTPKSSIARRLNCSRSTVYLKLNQLFPSGGTLGRVEKRTRRTGYYKADEQTLALMQDHIVIHRFAMNFDLIGGCRLKMTNEATVSRWLRSIGIGSYAAAKQVAITRVNKTKR